MDKSRITDLVKYIFSESKLTFTNYSAQIWYCTSLRCIGNLFLQFLSAHSRRNMFPENKFCIFAASLAIHLFIFNKSYFETNFQHFIQVWLKIYLWYFCPNYFFRFTDRVTKINYNKLFYIQMNLSCSVDYVHWHVKGFLDYCLGEIILQFSTLEICLNVKFVTGGYIFP